MNKQKFAGDFLEKCESIDRLRNLNSLDNPIDKFIQIEGKSLRNFSSNNYLGLANHPKLIRASEKAVQNYGTGTGASRLITGSSKLHDELEKNAAKWKRTEAALVMNSGYQANCGIIPAISDKNTVIFSDKLNHASIIDGILLSKAKLVRYGHLDMENLEVNITSASLGVW